MAHHEGPLNCKIAFVGEAFGAEEQIANRPFVGPAGRMLDDLLATVGISRLDCYVTNVFPWHPPSNDIKPFISFTNAGKLQHTSDEWLEALQRLKKELDECTANVIVALGNTAMYALTGRYGIMKWRGSIIESTLLEGSRKVIPTIHPAACLDRYQQPASAEGASWNNRYYITYDLHKIIKQAEFPEVKLPQDSWTLRLSPSYIEVMDYIRECAKQERIGSDIEVAYVKNTSRSSLTHWGLALNDHDVMCIPFIKGREDYFSSSHEASILKALAKLMRNADVAKVGQNYMFDSFFVLRRYNIITRNIEDTMIAQAILLGDFPKDLGFLTALYTDLPFYKDVGKEYFKQHSNELAFRQYNAYDALIVLPILEQQLQALNKFSMTWYYRHKCRLLEALHIMQARGIRMDTKHIAKLHEGAEAKIAQLYREIRQEVGYDINIDSPKQLMTYFYIEQGIKPYVKRTRGKSTPTVDAVSLVRLGTTHNMPVARKIVQARSLRTRNSTFYTMNLDDDGRLRCDFNPVGGGGSRLSSSQSIFHTGMNQQNQPAEIKRCMLADKGYLVFNLDLAQAENRIVAYIWNVYNMQMAFEQHMDVHCLTGGLIFGKPASQISRKKGSTLIGGGKYSERDLGKRANHAFNYGLGANTFAINNELTVGEARHIRTQYFSGYGEIMAGHDAIRAQLQKNRTLTDLLGRKRKFYGRWNDKLFRDGYAYIPQSTVGNMINMWGFEFMLKNPELFSGFEMLNNVHDAIVIQVPIALGLDRIATAIMALKASLEQPLVAGGKQFVIPVDIEFGLNLGSFDIRKNPEGCRAAHPESVEDLIMQLDLISAS